jgi:class 3 adenylate cyclase
MHTLNPAAQALFRDLESSSAAPAVVRWLRRLVEEGSDFDCYRINAFRMAREAGVAPLDSLRALLFATRLGIMDLSWDIHCPSCSGTPVFYRHLMDLQRRAHCPLCELRWDLSLEEQVEATFTVNGAIRPVDWQRWMETEWPACAAAMMRRLTRDGRIPPLMASFGAPGETVMARGTLEAGRYRLEVAGHPAQGADVQVSEAAGTTSKEQFLTVHADAAGAIHITPPPGPGQPVQLRAGPVCLAITHAYPREHWGLHMSPLTERTDWVSAHHVTLLQDFRDLFTTEYLAPDLSFAVRSVTLMFTDIRGSTEMYEMMGDARAYAVVQQHFALMTEVIRSRSGGIAKTIGDAVMAAFHQSKDAVQAALEIREGFAAADQPLGQVEVKLGLHRGPTIAVTSNRMLDYFGRTVNIAARVQGKSGPREILMTDEVAGDPEVAAELQRRGLTARISEVALKGIATPIRVHALG